MYVRSQYQYTFVFQGYDDILITCTRACVLVRACSARVHTRGVLSTNANVLDTVRESASKWHAAAVRSCRWYVASTALALAREHVITDVLNFPAIVLF